MDAPRVEIKHVLYATDFSENAKHAFAYAASLADQYRAKLTLLHVMREDFPDLLMFDVGTEKYAGVKKRVEITKEHRQHAKDAMIEMAKTGYGREAIDPEDIVVENGMPVQMILQVAEGRKCDLIVMGFRGMGTLEEAIMGDTVRRVLHRSKIPVLVVQPSKEK